MSEDSWMPAEGETAELLPRRRADVEVRRDAAGAAHVLHDPSSGVRSVVNETALAIWQLCDGATRPHEMVRGACELFGAPGEVVAGDVHRALADLSAAELVDWVRAPGGVDRAEPHGPTGSDRAETDRAETDRAQSDRAQSDRARPDDADAGRLADQDRRP